MRHITRVAPATSRTAVATPCCKPSRGSTEPYDGETAEMVKPPASRSHPRSLCIPSRAAFAVLYRGNAQSGCQRLVSEFHVKSDYKVALTPRLGISALTEREQRGLLEDRTDIEDRSMKSYRRTRSSALYRKLYDAFINSRGRVERLCQIRHENNLRTAAKMSLLLLDAK